MNNFEKYVVTLFATFLLWSCARPGIDAGIPQSWRTEAIKSAIGGAPSMDVSSSEINESLAISGIGVRINFEGTQGWTHRKNKTNEFQFHRDIDRRNLHTAAIRIYPIFPPRTSFDGLDDFFSYTKANLETLRDKNGNDIEFGYEPSSEKAPLCVAFNRKRRVTDEKIALGRSLVLEAYEYICKHPFRPAVFINLHYSELYPMTVSVSDAHSRAESMFKSISFYQ